MNSSTTSPLGNDFARQLVESFLNAIDEGTRQAYRMIWNGISQFLIENWGWVIVALVAILILAVVNYFATGRWAMLGSVLYNYFYFGILLIITLIFGPEVFANDWFKIVLFIVYVVCFVLVGKLLKKAGIRR
jgi:CDP-diglyceride synthetase